MCNFFFCHYVFKKPLAAEASESVYMRERVNKQVEMYYERLLCCMWESRVKHGIVMASLPGTRGYGDSITTDTPIIPVVLVNVPMKCLYIAEILLKAAQIPLKQNQ